MQVDVIVIIYYLLLCFIHLNIKIIFIMFQLYIFKCKIMSTVLEIVYFIYIKNIVI